MTDPKSFDADRHKEIMDEIQSEWKTDQLHHEEQRRRNYNGVRSSQLSALVAYLMKRGVIE